MRVLIARQLGADTLLIATDVKAVMTGWGTPLERPLGVVSVAELRGLAERGEFGSGSMGPKVDDACRFAAGAVRRSSRTWPRSRRRWPGGPARW